MGDNADDAEYDDSEYDYSEYGDVEDDGDGAAEVEAAYEAGDEETVPRSPAAPTDTDVFLDVPLSRSTRSTWTSRISAPMCRSRPTCSTC